MFSKLKKLLYASVSIEGFNKHDKFNQLKRFITMME